MPEVSVDPIEPGQVVYWRGVVGHEAPRRVTVQECEPGSGRAVIDGGRVVERTELYGSRFGAVEAHRALVESHIKQVREWEKRIDRP